MLKPLEEGSIYLYPQRREVYITYTYALGGGKCILTLRGGKYILYTLIIPTVHYSAELGSAELGSMKKNHV